MANRVVITGLGVLSAVGKTTGEFWRSISEGLTGIGPIEGFSTAGLCNTIAAQIRQFDPAEHFSRQEAALLDRVSQLGVVAAGEALEESGLDLHGDLGVDIGVVVGSGAGGLATLEEGYRRLYGQGVTRLHPFTVPAFMPSAVASQISMRYGLRGPSFVIASACSSGTHAIGTAFHMVRSGASEVVVTGGTEAALTHGCLLAWEALRVLAGDTCRPFSRDRRGLVLGEGAAILVLEELEHARRRAAPIRGEIVGFGMSADAEDIVQPSEKGASRAIVAALADGRTPVDAVDYVNAHGTGTAANDVVETRTLRRVFGEHADRLLVSSTKSMVGHSLGAAGALEAAATALCLEHGVVHPTINYLGPDPECDLDYVANEAREREIRVAVSNSFAFGGLNAVLVLRRFA